jgi:Zn-dependent protease with chaperone function
MIYDYSSFHSGMRERFGNLLVLSLLSVSLLYTINGSVLLGDSTTYSESVAFGLHATALFIYVVVLFYLVHPIQVRRSFAVSGISRHAGTFLQKCADVARRCGDPAVSLSLTNDIEQQNALAYGLPGWRRLLVGGGLRVVAAKRPERFEAVLAHEVSHLHHRDVDFTYLSRAILYSLSCAFLILLLPYIHWVYQRYRLSLGIGSESLALAKSTLVFQAGIITFVLLLVNIEYRALLRSREHYADVDATRYVGSSNLLDTFRAAHPVSPNFFTIFRTHPTPSSRGRVVENPQVLLRTDPLQAVLTGLVASQVLLFTNMIAREFPGGTVPTGVTLEKISVAIFAGAVIVLLLSVIASQNLRIVTSYSLGFSSFGLMIASSISLNIMLLSGCVVGYFWWLFLGNLSGPFVLQLVKLNISDNPFLTCIVMLGGILFYNIVLSVFLREVLQHRELQHFSMKWRIFLSILWMWGAYHAGDFIGTLFTDDKQMGLDKRLGAGASALVPVFVCFLTWLSIRLRKADREKEELANIEGVLIEKDVSRRPITLFGMKRDQLGLIAICIGIIVVGSMILQYSPNVGVCNQERIYLQVPRHIVCAATAKFISLRIAYAMGSIGL